MVVAIVDTDDVGGLDPDNRRSAAPSFGKNLGIRDAHASVWRTCINRSNGFSIESRPECLALESQSEISMDDHVTFLVISLLLHFECF